jgi:hypothetical protein
MLQKKLIDPKMLQKTISIIRKFRDSKLVAPILFIISLIYIVLLFFYSFPALKALDWNGIWKTIIYCFFLVGLSLFIQFICWSLLMEKGFDNILLHASVYFRTLIFRQLPGGITLAEFIYIRIKSIILRERWQQRHSENGSTYSQPDLQYIYILLIGNFQYCS